MKNTVLLIIIAFTFTTCASSNENIASKEQKDLDQFSVAYFASGCFWCVEAIFESVKGVEEVFSGYSGGKDKNPTYELVSSGLSDHAEAVQIYYDSTIVDFATLVKIYYGSHDPSQVNRQGPDRGRQYRSIAFYQNDQQRKIIELYVEHLLDSKKYDHIATEVIPFEKFYKAEDYHQDYEKLNPNNSYVRNVSIPRLNSFKRKFPELLK